VQEATIRADDNGGVFWAHIIIKNAGVTSATADCLGGIGVGHFPEPFNFLPPTEEGPRAVLLPGCTITHELGSKFLTSEEMIAIRSNALTLFAYGEIRYTDFFGEECVTTYRLMAQPQDLRPGLKKTAMLVCREGNSMT
jgi:hypothetical protein